MLNVTELKFINNSLAALSATRANLNNLNMKTTVSDRLTNRQLFELCKEFTMKQMEENAYKHVFQMFQLKNSLCPNDEYIASDALDHWAVMYTLNYNAPQS